MTPPPMARVSAVALTLRYGTVRYPIQVKRPFPPAPTRTRSVEKDGSGSGASRGSGYCCTRGTERGIREIQ